MDPQNSTTVPAVTPVEQTPALPGDIDARKQAVIDYYAVQGLLTDEEGNIKKMSVTELAARLHVDRGTIYDWKESIPGFWDHVAKARQKIGGQNRVQTVWNGVFLQAAKGKPEQAKMFLANFDPNFRMPNDNSDRDTASTLVDLMNAARALQQEQNRNTPLPPQQQPLTAAPIPRPEPVEAEIIPQ